LQELHVPAVVSDSKGTAGVKETDSAKLVPARNFAFYFCQEHRDHFKTGIPIGSGMLRLAEET
jgi:hypothetical protein